MKIGLETIDCLVQKRGRGGTVRHYWDPSPRLRQAGWKTLTLPNDLSAAIVAARARNREVAEWQDGAAKPAAVEKFIKAATLGHGIKRYRAEKLSTHSKKAQKADNSPLKRLEEWAGDQPMSWITRDRVRKLRDAMCPGGAGTAGHSPAFKTLKKGRELFAWFVREGILPENTPNPFAEHGLVEPDPRQIVWEPDDVDAICAAADALGLHSIGFAVRIGTYTGQREGDLLLLNPKSWQEVTLRQLRFDKALHADLASDTGPDAGKVMGIRVRQSKGKRWIGAPIEGAMRAEIEAAVAAAEVRVAGAAVVDMRAYCLIVKDKGDNAGQAWGESDFQHRFKDVRDHAIALAIAAGDQERAERLATLQFRDLRRTCVVTLGELGLDNAAISAITGHKLGTIEKILETYMPRTEAMAARAVVARIGLRAERANVKEEGHELA